MSFLYDIISVIPPLSYANNIIANISTSLSSLYSYGPPAHPVGGYIPFVDLPCERYIGESFGWTIILSVFLPVTCQYIPWLCCPIPFEFNRTNAISADIACDELGAYYGSSVFWTMEGVSIFGLVISMMSLARCSFDFINGTRNVSNPVPNLFWKASVLEGLGDISPYDPPDAATIEANIKNIIQTNLQPKEGEEGPSLNRLVFDDYAESRSGRLKRSAGFLGIPIPILRPVYRGVDETPDICERDEVLHIDGDCYQLLSQGPCEDNEYVLLDIDTKKGYCAPRLCNPDRVFVFGDQKCHDPYENDICPSGRILFTSSYGSPVCGCPYGTYEDDEDSDDDVCQPILAKIDYCPPGEVFWFRNFKMEPECLTDPCKGLNAKKGVDELAYAPSMFDGKCYQLGEELPQCPSDTFYTLSFKSLMGICASLEDAGYTVLDEDMLNGFSRLYGSRLPRESVSSAFSSNSSSGSNSKRSHDNDGGSGKFKGSLKQLSSREESSNSISRSSSPKVSRPKVGSSAVSGLESKVNRVNLNIGQSVTGERASESDSRDSKRNPKFQMFPTHASAFSPSTISLPGTSAFADLFKQFLKSKESTEEESSDTEHSRKKRQLLSHAAPETVFQSTLAACRAGEQFGVNFKCQTKYLPNRLPKSRPKRNIGPISPYPNCPAGSWFSITRKCVSSESRIRSNLIANGLG